MEWNRFVPKFLRSTDTSQESDISLDMKRVKTDIAHINKIDVSKIDVYSSTIGAVKGSEDKTPCIVFTVEADAVRGGIVRPYSTGKYAVYWKRPDGSYT